MKIRAYIYSLLVTINILPTLIASQPLVAPALHEKVEEIQARTARFATVGYTNEADTLARQNTSELLKPLANRVATIAEAESMVTSHLSLELYYAFNTQWGIGKVRNHRIIYDFLCQLDKATAWNAMQKEHFTVLTILSLAAQEYFWNEKSTVIDLKSRIKQELGYGLFNQPGHKLNITNLAYLDDITLSRLINKWIDDSLVGKLRTLMTGFRAKTLGSTYMALIDDLTTKFAGVTIEKLFLDLRAPTTAAFGITSDADGKLDLKPVPSVGDGMCGEHSLFIPTDGGMAEIQEGNGRYKILRAIFDGANTPEARRLYLLASRHMDGSSFIDLINGQIAALRPTSSTQADELQAKLDAYRESNQKATSEIEDFVGASKKALVKTVAGLPGVVTALTTLSTKLNTPDQLLALASNKTFRSIINELIQLRGVNAELERLLCTIDADILRLNGEITAAKLAAEAKFPQDQAAAIKTFHEIRSDFEAFKQDAKNAVLLQKALELIAAHKKVFTELARLSTVSTTPAPTLQATQAAVDAAAKEFTEFQTANSQFFVDYGTKETACTQAAKAAAGVCVNYAERDAKLLEKHRLIGDTLKGFIGASMLPEASASAFTVDALSIRYSNFVNEICQELCGVTDDEVTRAAIQTHWDAFQNTKMLMEAEKERQSTLRRLEIATSLPVVPAELSSESLKAEMIELANRPGELSGWLPCDALYTQLWAVLNNLNVFVFSSGEEHGRSPLDVMTRLKDCPYEGETSSYPADTTGTHLATVILTSPTAKNVFLNKSPAHYDKFISPGDLAAMARELRHVNWSALGADRYKLYPTPDPVISVPPPASMVVPVVTATTS
jgi:hypothetical protein